MLPRRVLPLLFSLLPVVTLAQQLLPSNLPACSKQCTVLQQASTGCLPSGGAPQSSQGVYQSCFCQSALLTQLYTSGNVQLCTTCSSSDMTTIQNWYKNFCGKGGAPLPGGNQNTNNNNNNNNNGGTQTTTTANGAQNPTSSASSSASKGEPAKKSGPWISTHWKWILMLIIIIIGLVLFTIAFVILHRRYHRQRMTKWSMASGSQPNINTWGPGQSVHDLGFTNNHRSEQEKGRAGGQILQQPQPAHGGHRDREKPRRFSGRIF